MTEPNLDRFSIRFADEWEPRPWPTGSIREAQEGEQDEYEEQEDESK